LLDHISGTGAMTAEGFNIGLLGAFNNKGNEFDVPSSPVSAARRLTADMSKEYGQMVDETIHLWSKMVVDESDEKNRIFTNIRKMQTNGRALQNDLQVKLDSLLKVALEGMSKIAEFHLAAKQDKRLRHLKRAFLGVFMHRQLTRAMVKWSAEVLRTRKAAKAAKMAFRWKHRVSNLPWPLILCISGMPALMLGEYRSSHKLGAPGALFFWSRSA
jgi:hypothetical protein